MRIGFASTTISEVLTLSWASSFPASPHPNSLQPSPKPQKGPPSLKSAVPEAENVELERFRLNWERNLLAKICFPLNPEAKILNKKSLRLKPGASVVKPGRKILKPTGSVVKPGASVVKPGASGHKRGTEVANAAPFVLA